MTEVLKSLRFFTGVGLRTLYLPGLQGLKEELRMMDWLMERLMPELKQHLDASGPYHMLLCILLSPLAAASLASCRCIVHLIMSQAEILARYPVLSVLGMFMFGNFWSDSEMMLPACL